MQIGGLDMTIIQMQYFAAVCEYGSISRSAEVLHISQPSISMAIKDLEKEFGIILFHRENKQLRISQEGMYIYERIKDILNRINSLEVQMADIGSQQSRLCLGIPNFTGMYLFFNLMGDFHHENPGINFEVKQCSSSMAFKMLDNGSCVAAIIVEPDTIPDNLDKHPVLSSEFVYCVNSSHPLAGVKSVSLSEIQNEPLILSEEESFMTKQIKKHFYDEGLVPNTLLYAAQLPLIKEFVYSGKAGTFLSKELAETFPEIATIQLKEKISVNFSLVWNKDRSRSRDARVLIDYIIARSPINT
jgi:DNA-binding transcriptional LysR family regulator